MRPSRLAADFLSRVACALLVCACASVPLPAPLPAPEEQGEHASATQVPTWQSKVDEVCAAWNKPGSPGCAVGVIRDGQLVFVRGYGFANLEYGLPITAHTVFDLGSTSKQFTATCIGLLEQDGVLSADDDLSKWVPEIPDYGKLITLRHLLNHTSGLRDYLELFLLAGRKTEDWTTSAQALAMLARQKELNFEPGAEHLYCNSGYFLLSLVVERASKKTLAQFAKERIFDPLGMHESHFHDDHTLLVKNRATGYSPREGGGFGIDMSDFEQTGDGGLMTTVGDLAKWDQNFYTHQVGGDALQTFLHRKGRLNDGRELDYASGLSVDTYRGLPRVSHGGAWAGYRAQLMRFPEQRCSIICLANLSSVAPSQVCTKIATILLGDQMKLEPPTDPRPAVMGSAPSGPTAVIEDPSAYAGVYESTELDARMEVVVRDKKLYVGDVGDCDLEILRIARDRFGASGLTFDFVRDEAGATTGFKAGSGRMRNVWFARVTR